MMRLIDADKIPWTDLNDNPNSKIRVLVTFADKVNRMPTIEPEPQVVRCKDCKHWTKHEFFCSVHVLSPKQANDYCSRAERKTDEKENI